MATLGRRTFLGALGATWASFRAPAALADVPATPPSPPQDFDVLDFTVEGDRLVGNRFVLCVPKHLAKDEKVPLLVALHGAAETSDPRTGAYAFVERYGLGAAYARLRRPPVVRTLAPQDYFGDKLLSELNTSLVSRPFKGIAIACPYMPWAAHMEHESKVLDDYTSWIADVVIPRARREAPVHTDAAHTTIDGVSLGGYTGIEVFLRRPELFGAWGCVQGALGSARIAGYAERLAAVHQKSPKDLHLETSKNDPFHDTTLSLSDALAKRGVPHELLVYPGPHDQPWLRESGTIGMLRWHDCRER
jgi:iron(III)-salmochelin esterase